MREVNKTKGDGSPIVKGDQNVITNTFIKNHGFLFKVFVGLAFFACLIVVYGFYNVGTYPVFKGNICITDRTPSGNIVNFIYKVVSNDREIVYFNNVAITNFECDENLIVDHDPNLGGSGYYYINNDGDKNNALLANEVSDMGGFIGSSYKFNFMGFVDNIGSIKENDDLSFDNHAKYLLEFNKVKLDDKDLEEDNYDSLIKDLSFLWIKSGSGYNIEINLEPNKDGKYTTIRNGDLGYEPLLDGLVQINSDWQGEQVSYNLSAPDPADIDNKKYECTKLDKSKFIKFFVCPFL